MMFLRFSAVLIGLMCAAILPRAAAQTVISTTNELYLPTVVQTGATTNLRSPTVAQLTLTGLTSNATYRYTVGGTNLDNITTGTAPGNYFGIEAPSQGNSGGIITGYTSSKSMNGSLMAGNENTGSGRYSQFTADASGNYTGWFALQPTGNAAFTQGNNIYYYVQVNDGAGGTTIAQSFRTTTTVSVIRADGGTANARPVVGYVPDLTGEQFVLLYDNVSGTGRPIGATYTENDGITRTDNTVWYAATNGPDGVAGRFGAYLQSGNANGIRRVEIRNFDGTLANSYTSANGVWFDPVNGGTIDTSNLIAGTSAVYFSPVPEPATMLGVSVVVGGSLMLLRRRRNSASA